MKINGKSVDRAYTDLVKELEQKDNLIKELRGVISKDPELLKSYYLHAYNQGLEQAVKIQDDFIIEFVLFTKRSKAGVHLKKLLKQFKDEYSKSN